jgi:hypothetical protein
MRFTTQAAARKHVRVSYLGNINSSAKMIKNKKVSNNYTYIVYLAPAKTSGYNVCVMSTPECRAACLAESGRAKMELTAGKMVIRDARIKKTRLFFEDRELFMAWMISEMRGFQKKAAADGYFFSARLNGTSDIDWNNVLVGDKTIFEIFSEVQFYDYTKVASKFDNKPSNYHLTFSYTGRNWDSCEALLKAGENVAVVFDTKKKQALPSSYKGYEVIDGDLTDYRPLDGNGVIVGLRFKHVANEKNIDIDKSVFVVNTKDMV